MSGKGSRSGLHGPDKCGEALRDQGAGTYDPPPLDEAPDGRSTAPEDGERPQPGAAVRQQTPDLERQTSVGPELPEGLRRKLKGPYGKTRGRGN